jgi:PKD repeat protein
MPRIASFLNASRTPRRRGALVGFVSLLLMLFALPPAAVAADTAATRPPLPALQLGASLRGEAAIKALGRHLPQVAAHYRMTPERLRQLLRRDRAARIDAQGRLLFVDVFPPPPVSPTAEAPVAPDEPLDLNRTFQLHSKPGAARVIYLDFDGHVATNTAWSSGTIVAEPFNADGDPATFGAVEREIIQLTWRRVAEDYAPFDVDVTTEAPPAEALQRSSETDTRYGSRVVITRNTFYDCFCGGVAYVGVFNAVNPDNPDFFQPAWAFTDGVGFSDKNLAEVASHEAGHNLGLLHDGAPGQEYYPGHGEGETGWAPIMGVGYYQNLTQWSRGEYPGANNQEDDIEVISAFGLPLRTDDFADTLGAAVPLGGGVSGGNVVVDRRGLIEREADVDVFSFVSAGGPVQFRITPAPQGPNLDIAANLYDAAGNLLLRANPAQELEADISTTLPAGTYFLSIGGTGKGDLATGYSDYGSLGHYRISGSYPNSGAQAPVAKATALPTRGQAPLEVKFTGLGSSDPDGSIAEYLWDFGDGRTGSGLLASHTYTVAGRYTATLTVRDDDALTDTDSVGITVEPTVPFVFVDTIDLRVSSLLNRYFQCVARVTVRRGGGVAAGATVRGNWSGVTNASVSATTNSSGVATLRSPPTGRHGTCTFAVTDVSLDGHTYVPELNRESSESLTY